MKITYAMVKAAERVLRESGYVGDGTQSGLSLVVREMLETAVNGDYPEVELQVTFGDPDEADMFSAAEGTTPMMIDGKLNPLSSNWDEDHPNRDCDPS